jgi:hypothetical protein
MADSTPTGWATEVPESVWTGRVEFDLLSGRGWRVAVVEVVVRIESVTLWCGNRTLAVMDRDLFREWLIHPRQGFEIDDVTWSAQNSDTCISIDGSIPYVVPQGTVQHLTAVI